jgi:hypothetical protein
VLACWRWSRGRVRLSQSISADLLLLKKILAAGCCPVLIGGRRKLQVHF